MRFLPTIVALLVSGSALAADQEPIVSPAGIVPKQAVNFDDGSAHATPVTPANPLPTSTKGAANLSTGQVTAGVAATPIVAARPGRLRVLVNVLSANSCSFGGPLVSLATGYQLQPIAGASTAFSTAAALYGACSAPTAISFAEEY